MSTTIKIESDSEDEGFVHAKYEEEDVVKFEVEEESTPDIKDEEEGVVNAKHEEEDVVKAEVDDQGTTYIKDEEGDVVKVEDGDEGVTNIKEEEEDKYYLFEDGESAVTLSKALGSDLITIPPGTYLDWEKTIKGKVIVRYGPLIGQNMRLMPPEIMDEISSSKSPFYAVQHGPQQAANAYNEPVRQEGIQNGQPIYFVCLGESQLSWVLGLGDSCDFSVVHAYHRLNYRDWDEIIRPGEKEVRINFGKYKGYDINDARIPSYYRKSMFTHSVKRYWFARRCKEGLPIPSKKRRRSPEGDVKEETGIKKE